VKRPGWWKKLLIVRLRSPQASRISFPLPGAKTQSHPSTAWRPRVGCPVAASDNRLQPDSGKAPPARASNVRSPERAPQGGPPLNPCCRDPRCSSSFGRFRPPAPFAQLCETDVNSCTLACREAPCGCVTAPPCSPRGGMESGISAKQPFPSSCVHPSKPAAKTLSKITAESKKARNLVGSPGLFGYKRGANLTGCLRPERAHTLLPRIYRAWAGVPRIGFK
jgi:hypothetical protein